MAKIVYIGTFTTLVTAGKPPQKVRKYVNPDNIVLASIKQAEEGWVWSFKMSDGTSLDSTAFKDQKTALDWAVKHDIVQSE